MDITCQETLIININTFIINIDFAADFQQKRKEKKLMFLVHEICFLGKFVASIS